MAIKGPMVRDTLQWLVGLGVAINETVIRQEAPRWEVLVFAGILMGLPAMIGLLNLRPQPGQTEPITNSSESSSQSASSP